MGNRKRRLTQAVLMVILALGLSSPGAFTVRAAPEGAISASAETTSYKIDLEIGPVARMMTPDQAKGATSGEVMVDMPEVTFESITADRMPINHHIEVHVRNRTTGAAVEGIMPLISVTNRTTGMTYDLDRLVAMYDVAAGRQDLHFGKNLYLPPAVYTVKVVVGRGERTAFEDIVVSGFVR